MLKPLLQIERVVKATPQLLYAPVKAPGIVVGEVIGYGPHRSPIGVWRRENCPFLGLDPGFSRA